MDNYNYDTVWESFVSTLSWQVAQVNTKKVSGLDHLVLSKKWGISPKKALNAIQHTTQHGVYTVLNQSLSRWFKTMIIIYGTGGYCIMCTVIHCLPL